MSKKYFINNLNTYVGRALFHELRNDVEGNDSPNLIYGTYLDADSSEKLPGTKKMLKRGKPRLMRKYISECDVVIYDLHYGNPKDVLAGLEAMKKTAEEEKTFILITSLLAWDGTGQKLVPKTPPPPPEPDPNAQEVINNENMWLGEKRGTATRGRKSRGRRTRSQKRVQRCC